MDHYKKFNNDNYKRCRICLGSGKIMSGGMTYVSCETCRSSGKIKIIDDTDYLIIKQSNDYSDAIQDMKELGLSHEESEKIFKDTYSNIISSTSSDKPKRKYQRRDKLNEKS